MRVNRARGRMFRSVTHTATFIQGCTHGCGYCWARKMGIDHTPRLIGDEHHILKLRDAVVFLNSAHDPLSPGIPDEWFRAQLRWISRQHPSNRFLLQSKNPARFLDFPELRDVQDRVLLGTTLETNWDTSPWSKAPHPAVRAAAMILLRHMGFRLFLSLEPLMDLDPDVLADWVEKIGPQVVEIGLDNWRSHLQEPPAEKYRHLRRRLLDAGITLIEKPSIRRLM